MFRVHHDLRFAADQRPNKTNVAANDVHYPGFCLHREPGEVFFGAGIRRPDARALAAIRAVIVEDRPSGSARPAKR